MKFWTAVGKFFGIYPYHYKLYICLLILSKSVSDVIILNTIVDHGIGCHDNYLFNYRECQMDSTTAILQWQAKHLTHTFQVIKEKGRNVSKHNYGQGWGCVHLYTTLHPTQNRRQVPHLNCDDNDTNMSFCGQHIFCKPLKQIYWLLWLTFTIMVANCQSV